jgi:sugar phosphate isomerase/epimerase
MIQIGTYLMRDAIYTPEERLRIIKSAGFDFVCLNMDKLLEGETVGLTPAMCERVGMPIDNVHLTGKGTHAVWAEGERGDKVTARYCKEIALCREYGIKVGITHVTWGTSEPPPVGEIGIRRFEQIVECAERNGVILALENSVSEEHLAYVFDHIDSQNLGFCFDTGHRHAFAPNTNFIARYGHRLVATHLQDNDGKKDLHLLPLDGSIDWNKVARELASVPFSRSRICAEVAGARSVKREGMTKAEIEASLAHVSAMQKGLIRVEDGGFTPYADFTYEALIDRLYHAMQTIANRIEREHSEEQQSHGKDH